MADDGPDLSCFDFASSGDEQETREDVLKKHREEEEQLRAEAKAKKKAIDKSDKPARRACEAELAEALEQLAARHAKELAGFLWTPYEKEYYWWEIVRFLRILGLTAAAMMFQGGQIQDNDPDTSALNEMLLATGVLAMNLGAQYYARPYDDVRLDVMQSVASYTNFFTIFCGLAFLSPRTPSTVRNVLELANLILIGLSYVFFIYTLTVVVFSGAAKALERTLTRFRRRRQHER